MLSLPFASALLVCSGGTAGSPVAAGLGARVAWGPADPPCSDVWINGAAAVQKWSRWPECSQRSRQVHEILACIEGQSPRTVKDRI